MRKLLVAVATALLVAAILMGCGDSSARQPSADLLGWTGGDDSNHAFQLVRINRKTGAVTNIGGMNFFTGLAYGPDGTLYGISSGLYIINPSNGATTEIGTFYDYTGDSILMAAAAFAPDGTLYVIESQDPNRVFTVDLRTADLTYVGTPSDLIRSIAFSSDWTFYGAFADLYSVSGYDASTVDEIGELGSYIDSMTVDSQGGLFGIDNYPSTNVYYINNSTGHATAVTRLGSSNVTAVVEEHAPSSRASSSKALESSPPKTLEELTALENRLKTGRAKKVVTSEASIPDLHR